MLRAPITTVLALLTGAAIAALPALAAAQDAEVTDPTAEAVVETDATEGADEAASPPADEASQSLEPAAVIEQTDPAGEEPASTQGSDALAQQLRARQDFAAIHRAFGVATWLSMAVTAVFGWIQFADEYGFHDNQADTACANQTAVFQDFCTGVPWVHAIAGFTTAALYFTTAGLSLAMPAPLEASEDVEIHKTLRWFHLATMLATAVFGVVTANIDTDFQTRQALSLVHQGLGVTTFGLLTAAAAVVVF